MLLKKAFQPSHSANRMKNEGDVKGARQHYFNTKTANLKFLLQRRFEWMNKYIQPTHKGIEVGAGTGISKQFITNSHFKITDFANHDWLDVKGVDALKTPFASNEFNFIISSNMIHHVPYPVAFFKEMSRILQPGGYLLIQEINLSFFMRLLLRLMKHEGYNYQINIYDENLICTNPDDLWSANCAIPNLLFDNIKKFQSKISDFKIIHQSYSEFFNFLNSGGVIAKTAFIPLPKIFLHFFNALDTLLTKFFPNIFALQRQIVLQKIK